MKEKIKKALKKAKELEKKEVWTKDKIKKDDIAFMKLAKSLPKLLTGKFAKRKPKKKQIYFACSERFIYLVKSLNSIRGEDET